MLDGKLVNGELMDDELYMCKLVVHQFPVDELCLLSTALNEIVPHIVLQQGCVRNS